MDVSRRDFVKKGLLAAASAAAGAGLVKGLEATAAEPHPPNSEKPPEACPACSRVLTPEGVLMEVDMSKAKPVPRPPDDPIVRQGDPGRKWVMVIDLAKCEGCQTCVVACGKMHFIPPFNESPARDLEPFQCVKAGFIPSPRQWIRVFSMQDAPTAAPYWFPRPCFHCDDPPCTRVCPVNATFKRQDGTVLIDNERCIGCRFCMAACPYSVRVFNWSRPHEPPEATSKVYSPEDGFPRRVGTVEKCDFCPDMDRNGELPACVESCPHGAIYFGDQNEDAVTLSKSMSKGETVRLSELLYNRAGYRYLEELGTEPRVYYLPPKNRLFPAPARGQEVFIPPPSPPPTNTHEPHDHK